MEWRNLVFSVGEAKILRGVSGMLEPGHVTGIIGPSGCGKTTLLNVLSGRQKTSGKQKGQNASQRVELTGSLSVRGAVKKPEQVQRLVAYVFQDSALPELETPLDCMRFSAFLRLPAGLSEEAREGEVQRMLKQLRLEQCSDVIVGSVARKGISGGEQKRTAVGIELISSPRMVFLDEPLSGLDSYSAHSLMTFLRELASSGVTVLLTLHQPTSELFALLDGLIVMDAGEVCYHGPAGGLGDHLELLGFPCPEGFSATDHALCLVQDESPEVVRRVKDQWLECGASKDLCRRIDAAGVEEDHGEMPQADSSSSSEDSGGSSAESEANVLEVARQPRAVNKNQRCCLVALLALMARDLRKTRRNFVVFLTTYVLQQLFVSLGYSLLFFGAGRRENDESHPSCAAGLYDDAQCLQLFLAHVKFLSMVCFCVVYAAAPYAIQTLQTERSVFLRERAAGYYGVIPYFFSKMVFEIPQVALENLAILIGTYWLVGLQGNFFWLMLELELLALAASSMNYIFSAACSTPEKAFACSGFLSTLQFAFSGVLIPVQSIPAGLRWLRWLCPLYYGLGMLVPTEFSYLTEGLKSCTPGDDCRSYHQRLETLEAYGVDMSESWWQSVGMSAAVLLGSRALASLFLWKQSRFAQ